MSSFSLELRINYTNRYDYLQAPASTLHSPVPYVGYHVYGNVMDFVLGLFDALLHLVHGVDLFLVLGQVGLTVHHKILYVCLVFLDGITELRHVMILVIVERAQDAHRLLARLTVEPDNLLRMLFAFYVLLDLDIEYVVALCDLR